VRRQIMDQPSAIKAQDSPIPYLGGAAIVIAFAGAVMAAAAVRVEAALVGELAVILGLGVALGVMGLVDDLRGLGPWLRLAIEAVAAVAIWASPAAPDIFGNDVLNLLVTVAWVVGVTNAFNLLDNMDGLSAGVAAIAAASLFVLAAENDQVLVATLAISVTGCAVGFLRSNFHPARIYMGDSGSLFLGFLMAVLTMKLDYPSAPHSVSLTVPVILLGIPLFDTALVTINRVRHGRSPLSGGRDHASHRLVFLGVSVPAAVLLVYAFAATLGVCAFVVSRSDRTTALVVFGWACVVASLLGGLLSAVPVYESSRRRRVMLQEVQDREPEVHDSFVDDDE
jgi:UDP-GlcNAc:undecaprenyl-phosphate GlcNAc-1-phosphate transferase